MEKQPKLMQSLANMVFKVVMFIGFMVLPLSCWDPDEESCHQVRLANNTNHTLVVTAVLQHLCPSCESAAEVPFLLDPGGNTYIIAHPDESDFDMLNDWCGSKLDTVIVYKVTNDTLNSRQIYPLNNDSIYVSSPVIKWGGPLLNLPDSIHSFYNKNSWVFSKNPNNPKSTVITFTIANDDLKQSN